MKRIKVEIEGIKPFLFHKFNIESIRDMAKVKTGSAGNDPEEWKKSFFHNDGKLYVPGNYIFSTLKKGSFYTKSGRGSIQSTWISAIQVEDEIIFFDREIFKNWEEMPLEEVPVDPNEKVYVDVRMVANPNTKGRNVRYRVALSPPWKLYFNLILDDSLVSVQQAKKVVQDSGKLVGIADGRTLGYGRFKVNSFEYEDYKE